MAHRDLLPPIAIVVNGAKGISALLQLGRDLDCQYKMAFVLVHKLREAAASGDKGKKLNGHVEIDRMYKRRGKTVGQSVGLSLRHHRRPARSGQPRG